MSDELLQIEGTRSAPAPRTRKPPWLKVRLAGSPEFHETRRLMRELSLNTVCEEAACPNIGECWTKKHATVMILGATCTRACRFCNIKTGMPMPVDPYEREEAGGLKPQGPTPEEALKATEAAGAAEEEAG